MADTRAWAALEISSADSGHDDLVAAVLDDFSPAAIEDLVLLPIPPGGLWDPGYPPVIDPQAGPIHWRAFFETPAARDAAAAALRERWPAFSLHSTEVADDDWAARSQRAICAIRAGVFVIAPPWDLPTSLEADTTVVVIEPSRGFGTGHHASTRLCLRALSDIDVNGRHVLDLGTGSGVLAMAAAIKGARSVLAIDIDADAIQAAQESAALNTLPMVIEWVIGDFRAADASGVAETRDLVLANLTGGMLMSSAQRIHDLVSPGGLLVVSGFDEQERGPLQRAFAVMQERSSFVEDGWVGLVLEKSPVGGQQSTVVFKSKEQRGLGD